MSRLCPAFVLLRAYRNRHSCSMCPSYLRPKQQKYESPLHNRSNKCNCGSCWCHSRPYCSFRWQGEVRTAIGRCIRKQNLIGNILTTQSKYIMADLISPAVLVKAAERAIQRIFETLHLPFNKPFSDDGGDCSDSDKAWVFTPFQERWQAFSTIMCDEPSRFWPDL